MEIQPNGSTESSTSTQERIIRKLSENPQYRKAFEEEQIGIPQDTLKFFSKFKPEDFSPTPTQSHTIQISKIGLLGNLPNGVDTNWWVGTDTARKLQSW